MNIDTLQTTSEISPARIAELETRWNNSLRFVADKLYPSVIKQGDIGEFLTKESGDHFLRDPESQLIIGLCGPGAAGKGTSSRFLEDELGYAKVVNTTTRAMRQGEVHGKDYFFEDDEYFTTAQQLGRLALYLAREGRGKYGITHDEINSKLSASTVGCVIEENPANLISLFNNLDAKSAQKVLLYVLPKSPIVKSSYDRLQYRMSFETDPAKRIITPEVFESTLGDRQVDEFNELAGITEHPDIHPVFIINDDLNRTKSLLTAYFGANDAAA